jgi:hypothetical protein
LIYQEEDDKSYGTKYQKKKRLKRGERKGFAPWEENFLLFYL